MSDNSQPPVTVYSAVWCSFCHMAKNYFDKLGVKYVDRDVEKDITAAQESVSKSGQMGIPVIDIGGEIVVGFNRPAIDQLLKAKNIV